MANDIKYNLNAIVKDNTVTANPDDQVLEIVSQGTADQERIIQEMMKVNPGLELETLRLVFELEKRVVKELLLTGMRVNTGLYTAEVRARGVIMGGAWDASRNSLYVSMKQGADLREAIAVTHVNILDADKNVRYIRDGYADGADVDADTRVPQDGIVATAGRAFTIRGNKLKLAGDDPAVGITLTDADGTETKVPLSSVYVNEPKRLTFLIPAGLEDGRYTLTVTTQYSSKNYLLKEPASINKEISIGDVPQGSGGSGSDDDDSGQGTFG